MHSVNWWLMALSFLLGLVLTLFLLIRRVKREVPEYAGFAAGAGAAGAAGAAKLKGGAGVLEDEPYGVGSVRVKGTATAPDGGYTVKGNEDSMLYHTTDSPSWKQTIAEIWFRDTDSAERAGFLRWDSGGAAKAAGAAAAGAVGGAAAVAGAAKLKGGAADADADEGATVRVPKVDADADEGATVRVPKVDPDADVTADTDTAKAGGVATGAAAAAAGAAGGVAAAKFADSEETAKFAAVTDEPYGAGSARVAAGAAAPSGYHIKGNEDSMLYHTTDSPSYKQTIAEVWFRDEATAEAAGFTHWRKGRGAGGTAIAAIADVPPGRHGPGSATPEADGSGPAGWTIKGNEDSMLYHTLESPSYKRTIAEVWFFDEPTAEAAGFTHWKKGRAGAAGFADIPPGPHGPGSAKPGPGGSGPEGWTVKGNEDSMLYHSPESPAYDVTVAEVWFRDVPTAEAAGFNRWDSGKSQRPKG